MNDRRAAARRAQALAISVLLFMFVVGFFLGCGVGQGMAQKRLEREAWNGTAIRVDASTFTEGP